MSKPFSINEIKFYPKDECIKAKEKLKGYNYECMSIIHEHRIGSMNYIYDKFKPKNEMEFFNYWTDDSLYNKDAPSSEKGRSIYDLYDLTLEYQSMCDKDISAETYFKDILMHAIYQTWSGRKREEEIIEKLKSLGYNVTHSAYKDDSKLNIDLFVWKDGKLVFTLQIKPISTFRNNALWALTTRGKFFKMEAKAFKKYGVPHRYLIYNTHFDTDMKWVHNDAKNRFLFSLDEICTTDGKLIKGIDLTKNSESSDIEI